MIQHKPGMCEPLKKLTEARKRVHPLPTLDAELRRYLKVPRSTDPTKCLVEQSKPTYIRSVQFSDPFSYLAKLLLR